jgi:TonB family protein
MGRAGRPPKILSRLMPSARRASKMPGTSRESRWAAVYVAAFMISASLHAGLGTWLLVRPHEPAGFGGEVIDAFSVEMVDGTALESIDARQRVEQAGAHAAIASKPGQDIPVEVAEVAASQPAAVKEEVEGARPSETVARLPSQPEGEIEAAQIVKPDPAKETDPRPEDRPDREPGRKMPETDKGAVVQLPQEAKVQGGAASTAAVEGEAAPSASTSPGERSRYAGSVREALNPTRPRHEGMKGSVWVAFALSPTGAVQSVDVAKSSGSAVLDRDAVAAIRRTTFPAPPAGMSDAQRSYVAIYDYK